MATDEYHEALLDRVQTLQDEIARLPHGDAVNFAYLVSHDMPEEGARMLVAQMLLDHWKRSQRASPRTG